MISTLIISSWGDAVGRRYPLILTYVSNIVALTGYTLVLQFKLPLIYITVGQFLSAFLGNFYVGLASSFAFYADISTKDSRTVYISLGETMMGLGYLTTGLAIGPWFQAQV